MFRYPLEDNIFTQFFELLDGLLVANELNELVQMKMRVDKFERVHIIMTDTFSREIHSGACKITQKQTDLLLCESYLIRILAYVYEYKLQEVTNYGYQSGLLPECGELIEPDQLVNRSQGSFILCLHLYVAIIARVISVKPNVDYNQIENLGELVKHSCEISRMILSFEYALDTQTEEISCVPASYMQMIREGIHIASSDKDIAANVVESCVRRLMKIHVDQLMLARARQVTCVDDYKSLRIIDGDWQYASEFLTRITIDHILQIDMLAGFYNLTDYKEYRTLYEDHLKRHRLRDEYFTNLAYLYQSRITVVSGLITKNSTGDELEIAAIMLQKYLCKIYELYEIYLHLKNTPNDTNLINNIFLQQVEAVRFDATHLIYFAARSAVSDQRAKTALYYFQMTTAQASALLYSYDKVKYASLATTISAIRSIDLRFNHMFKWAKGSLFTILTQARLAIKLEACKDDASRLAALQSFVVELKLYITNCHQLQFEEDVRANISLLIADLYVLAIFECRNWEEYALLKDAELQASVFSLPLHADNKPIYEFLLMLAAKYKQLETIHLPIDQIPIAEMFLGFVEKLFVISGSALARLFTYEHRPCATVSYLFAEKAREVAKCVAENSISEEYRVFASKIFASSEVSRVNLHANGTKFAMQTSPARLTYMPASFAPVAPKPKKDVSASFLVGVQTPQYDARKKNKGKKKNKVTEPQIKQYHPKVTDDINVLKKHFKGDYLELYQFYFKALHKRDKYDVRCALLGAANTLYLLKDRAKSAKLAVTLIKEAELIRDNFINTSYESTVDEFAALIKPWRVIETPVAPKPKPVQAPVTVTVKAKAVPTLFKPKAIVEPRSAPAQKQVSVVKPPVKVVEADPFEGLFIDRQLPIVLTRQQELIINLLKSLKACPMVHGGTVIDLLFGIKPRDLDLLCFANITELSDLLNRRKDEFAIWHIRKLKHTDVLVIEFNKDIIKASVNRLSDYKLEILVLPPNMDKRLQLVNLARGFGVTFLLYDLTRNGVIDPVKLYSKLVDKHMLDIQPCAVDIEAYFKKYPGRMIDLLYRQAKFHRHQIPLTLSDELHINLKKYITLISPQSKHKLSLETFDKIFMQGLSCQFMLEFAQFTGTERLIPNINAALFPAFINFCIMHDTYIQQHENLSLQEFEQVRTAFFINGFYDAFMLQHQNDVENYRQNENQFYRDSAAFLVNFAFDLSHDSNSGALINSVQNAWWERIQHLFSHKLANMLK